LLQVADGGTLFLDEVGELPKAMQAKLLRFLESGEVRRVGDNESCTCDVRVICATNRDLAERVAAGEFREDLWFRVNTIEIPLPPLATCNSPMRCSSAPVKAPLRCPNSSLSIRFSGSAPQLIGTKGISARRLC
jgi:transcriptional regulator of aromatic amino acid metabolism